MAPACVSVGQRIQDVKQSRYSHQTSIYIFVFHPAFIEVLMQCVRYAEQVEDVLPIHFRGYSVYRTEQIIVRTVSPAAPFGYDLDRVRRRSPALLGRLETVA